jgi:hypothetical protein
VTITVYGELVEVERFRTMVEDLQDLRVEGSSGPTAVADGSGRYRVYMTARL